MSPLRYTPVAPTLLHITEVDGLDTYWGGQVIDMLQLRIRARSLRYMGLFGVEAAESEAAEIEASLPPDAHYVAQQYLSTWRI
jgi:hypothetical protein